MTTGLLQSFPIAVKESAAAQTPSTTATGEEQRMSKPEQEQREQEELGLDPETVKDLEVDDETAEQVQGGGATHHNCIGPTAPIGG
jgi:hypothetical protein